MPEGPPEVIQVNPSPRGSHDNRDAAEGPCNVAGFVARSQTTVNPDCAQWSREVLQRGVRRRGDIGYSESFAGEPLELSAETISQILEDAPSQLERDLDRARDAGPVPDTLLSRRARAYRSLHRNAAAVYEPVFKYLAELTEADLAAARRSVRARCKSFEHSEPTAIIEELAQLELGNSVEVDRGARNAERRRRIAERRDWGQRRPVILQRLGAALHGGHPRA